MFDEGKRRPWTYTWPGIFATVIIVLVVLQMVRVNPPEGRAPDRESQVIWSLGTIFNGNLELPANSYRSFPLNTNKRFRLRVNFTTLDNKKRVSASVLRDEDFNMWKTGVIVTPLSATGPVPRATINSSFAAGKYVLIIDNSDNATPITLFDVSIIAD